MGLFSSYSILEGWSDFSPAKSTFGNYDYARHSQAFGFKGQEVGAQPSNQTRFSVLRYFKPLLWILQF